MTDKEQTIQTLNKQLDKGVGLVNAMTLEIDGLRQEIDRLQNENKKVIATADLIDERNQRYHEALRFYANKKTYELSVQISMGSAFPRHEPIEYDKGEKARQALEGKQ